MKNNKTATAWTLIYDMDGAQYEEDYSDFESAHKAFKQTAAQKKCYTASLYSYDDTGNTIGRVYHFEQD